MSIIINWIVWAVCRLFYRIRGHDSRQIINSIAFRDSREPNIILEAPECGRTGSPLLPSHTCLADDGDGKIPELRWRVPQDLDAKQYVLACEDLDAPLPFWVNNNGLFFGIPPSVTELYHDDTEQDTKCTGRLTLAGWGFVPNYKGVTYTGAAAPLGHGTHRYVFTIIALDETLQLDRPDKATKSQIKKAMIGKVIGWGQWIGHFERPWPR
ncbi:phosphatidylethanolamine-binding protein [Aspergillus karnatakaensis]|uniref:YbhB/YbcL family Raf kinase inhibitor-like protein n=1 Tax=Aspergillus karnatakaensis TaxID=1810916 RepID=UPI003CCD28C7